MLSYIERVVRWVRQGYPQGIPAGDYVPLFALLRRRLSDEECEQLGRELVARGIVPADQVDVAVGYLRITDELPAPEEIARVTARLTDAGWIVDDEGTLVHPPADVLPSEGERDA